MSRHTSQRRLCEGALRHAVDLEAKGQSELRAHVVAALQKEPPSLSLRLKSLRLCHSNSYSMGF